VLEILHSRDKSLSILTTKGTEQITKMLEILKIKHFFDVIYGRDLPYGEKPNKQCVDYMLSQLPNKFTKEQVVIVGDTEIDLQTAQNSGVDFIAVTYGIGSREELALAGAKRFIDSFDQILKYS
jgi:phosphoglycolate phosphatase